MKELSIEEKARNYDKAREKIAIRFGSNVADEIFSQFEMSEDERIRKALLEMVHDTTGDELWVDYNVHKEDALAWLEKQGEQKPADVRTTGYWLVEDTEQKPSWSEEDEEIHRKCICAMRDFACGFPEEEKFVEQVDNWFKSLKERYTWKPSDEQMEALDDYIYAKYPNKEKHQEAILSLFNDLKKLKG